MAEMTYRDAVAHGIAQEMARDERVVFRGEDVAAQPVHEGQFRFVGIDDHYFMVAAIDPGPARLDYRPVTIVDTSEKKRLDLTIEVPVEDMARMGQADDIPSGPASSRVAAGRHAVAKARATSAAENREKRIREASEPRARIVEAARGGQGRAASSEPSAPTPNPRRSGARARVSPVSQVVEEVCGELRGWELAPTALEVELAAATKLRLY